MISLVEARIDTSTHVAHKHKKYASRPHTEFDWCITEINGNTVTCNNVEDACSALELLIKRATNLIGKQPLFEKEVITRIEKGLNTKGEYKVLFSSLNFLATQWGYKGCTIIFCNKD